MSFFQLTEEQSDCIISLFRGRNKSVHRKTGESKSMFKNGMFMLCLLCSMMFVIFPGVASAVNCTWPDYENTVRSWGQVYEVQPSGGHVVAFTISSWTDGTFIRFDCGYPANLSLGCDLVSVGDSILVSGHQKDRTSCVIDGIDNYSVPNVIWKCAGHTAGTCVQVTPCI